MFAASHGYIDDIIVPSKTRSHIYKTLELLKNKKVDRICKKQDNLPL
nr:carboxyl transferase domain-containing protein [Wolbachia endosymbiont of Atemnus politus]